MRSAGRRARSEVWRQGNQRTSILRKCTDDAKQEAKSNASRPAELLLALLRIIGTYSVEPKSVGILSSCFVMYPTIESDARLMSPLAGTSLTRVINRHSHLPSGPFRTSMRPVGDDAGLMSSRSCERKRACVRGMLFERTDKAQVEHLGGEESDAWKRQRLRIPSCQRRSV